MPSQLSSPPLRHPRSPSVSMRSTYSHGYGTSHLIETPPMPQWDTPTSPYHSTTLSMTRSNRHVLSPHRAAPVPPPVPPLPSSPSRHLAMFGITSASPVAHERVREQSATSSPISRSTSSSSTASSSSSTSQRVSTPPPPPNRSRRNSKSSTKLLPALALTPTPLDEQTMPSPSPQTLRSKSTPIDYLNETNPVVFGIDSGIGGEEVQIVINREARRSRAVSISVPGPRSAIGLGLNVSSDEGAIDCLPPPAPTGLGISMDRSPNSSLHTYTNKRRPSPFVAPSINLTIENECSTPPRPARRSPSALASPAPSARRSPSILSLRPSSRANTSNDLLPPHPSYARSISPSGDSISTVTVSPSSTPRPEPLELPKTSDSTSLSDSEPSQTSINPVEAYTVALGENTPMGGRKRDSAQRRLSALRGLVANLDFNQPWSLSEKTLEEENNIFSPGPSFKLTDETQESQGGFFWACGSQEDECRVSDESITESFVMSSSSEDDCLASPAQPISTPLPYVRTDRPRGANEPDIAETHGWPEAKPNFASPELSSPKYTSEYPFPRAVEVTPLRRTNSASRNKQPSLTPPRRPRQLRSSSELLSRTPEPPRPASRARREVFDVASSGYSKCLEPVSPVLPATPTSTWRSSLSSDATYSRLMQTQGPIEVKRQEIIWEMCETEHAFIKSMRTVLRLFAIPLKTPQGEWISGIPGKITDLFDSLESITHAHGVISAAERDMRRRSETIDVGAFVSTFKGWVSMLHVHERYLLRFEAVVQLVEDNVRDPDSVFGEFVRMQMKEEVLGSMSLGSMLLKPVQRLTKYPLFLKRLLDVTPHPHPAHPDILSLLSLTESIILTLQATKAREEDFEQLQAIGTRLHGLPEGFALAQRGRKLLGQGQVVRIVPGRDLVSSFGGAVGNRGRAGSFHSSRGSISSTVSSSAPSTAASSISPWDFSASLTPSRTSAFSVSSTNSSYYGPPSRSNSVNKHHYQASPSPSRPSTVTRSPSSTSSFSADHSSSYSFSHSRPTTPSSAGKSRKKEKEENLTMLVFDDLVILGHVTQERAGGLFGVGAGKKKGEKGMKVLAEIEGGIGKVAEVRDWSGWGGHSTLFSVTIVPVSSSIRNPMSPITHCFTLPSTSVQGGMMAISPSLRSLKSSLPSSSSSSALAAAAAAAGLGLTCPTIKDLGGWFGMLGQTVSAARGSDYVLEEKEVLEESEGEMWGEEEGEGYAG
ncbi:hypothetical protein IAR55_005870 [Kwoniella newhampshirensis]|uniref:DH domain-containing protein n=1 Tax=Kwoniella newhampshirensis TaxID=1651941 RepID=A0AAW0YVQ8_9TREE